MAWRDDEEELEVYRRARDGGDADDDPDDPDDPDDADVGGEDATVVARCPYCRAAIYDGAERCPKCHSYISEEDAPAGRPLWAVVVTGALLAAIIVGWLILGR